ncbi:MAG: hypothetical protein PHP00_05745 [Thiotrichaceae bacterium]|nr:hypothetical protein [Thiotrichaceae bacterium]
MKLTRFLKNALRRALLLSTMSLLVACHEERSTLLESPPPANQKPIPAAVVVPAGSTAPAVPATTGTTTSTIDCTLPQQSNLCKPAVTAPK